MKKILSAALCFVLLLTLLPTAALAVDAGGFVLVANDGSALVLGSDYTFESGVLTIRSGKDMRVSMVASGTTTGDVIKIAANKTANLTLNGVSISTNTDSALEVGAGATLNLTLDGANSLTASGANYAALHVPEGSTLNVSGPGSLAASATDTGAQGAGIGGASGSNRSNCGTVNISGGNVTASSNGSGAGIGGGHNGSGGTVNISGGTVNATGNSGAGIGGGCYVGGGTVTISGGTVTATGNGNGAGIGGGDSGNGGTVNISGGTVTATGKGSGAGIGGGNSGSGGTVTISGGTVTATGNGGAGIGGAGIGGGDHGSGGTVTISGGTINATGNNGAGIGGGGSDGGGTVKIYGGIIKARSTAGASIGSVIAGASAATLTVDYAQTGYKWSHVEGDMYTSGTPGSTTTITVNDTNTQVFTGIWPAAKYAVEVTPTTLDFGSITAGGALPAAQKVKVINRGWATVRFAGKSIGVSYNSSPSSGNIDLDNGDSFELTVQPTTQTPGNYDSTISFDFNSNPSGITANLKFTVATPTSSSGGSTSISEEYDVIKGQNGAWARGSAGGLGFTVNADYGKFLNVWVDGVFVSGSNYTARAGSTIIEFKPEYLATLSAGLHTLRVNFIDGYAESHFTVGTGMASVDLPKTGDASVLALALCSLAAAAAGVNKRR